MDRIGAIIWLRFKLMARRAAGAGGTLNLLTAVLVALLGTGLALGLAAGFGIWAHFAQAGGDALTLLICYSVVFYTFLFFAFGLPLLPGGLDQDFDVARFRVYPMSRGQMFGIHLAASFGSGEHLMYYPALIAVLVAGVLLPAHGVLAGTAVLLLLLGFLVIWNNALTLVLTALLRQRRLREILAFLAVLVLVLVSFTPVLLGHYEEDLEQSLPALKRLVAPLLGLARTLPPSLAATGLTALTVEGGAGAGGSLAGLGVWNVLGLALGYFVFARYHMGDPPGRATSASKTRARGPAEEPRWLSFEHGALDFVPLPIKAVAAKDLHYLFRSVGGRLNLLLLPLFVILVGFVVAIESTFLGIGPENLVFYGLLLYATLFSNNFVYNAYAWEAEGVQAYFLSPVSTRAVIAGKNLAVWLYNVVLIAVFMTVWCALVRLPDVWTLLTALLLFTASLLSFTAVGNLVSVYFPVRREPTAMNNTPSQFALLLSLVSLAINFGVISLFMFVPAVLGLPFLQPIALGLLVALLVPIYLGLLSLSARTLEARKERLIETLRARS